MFINGIELNEDFYAQAFALCEAVMTSEAEEPQYDEPQHEEFEDDMLLSQLQLAEDGYIHLP